MNVADTESPYPYASNSTIEVDETTVRANTENIDKTTKQYKRYFTSTFDAAQVPSRLPIKAAVKKYVLTDASLVS